MYKLIAQSILHSICIICISQRLVANNISNNFHNLHEQNKKLRGIHFNIHERRRQDGFMILKLCIWIENIQQILMLKYPDLMNSFFVFVTLQRTKEIFLISHIFKMNGIPGSFVCDAV